MFFRAAFHFSIFNGRKIGYCFFVCFYFHRHLSLLWFFSEQGRCLRHTQQNWRHQSENWQKWNLKPRHHSLVCSTETGWSINVRHSTFDFSASFTPYWEKLRSNKRKENQLSFSLYWANCNVGVVGLVNSVRLSNKVIWSRTPQSRAVVRTGSNKLLLQNEMVCLIDSKTFTNINRARRQPCTELACKLL